MDTAHRQWRVVTCHQCGIEPPVGSVFCNGCGARLELTCTRCGASPPPGSTFCNGCGANLRADAPDAAPVGSSPPAIDDRSPSDYTPKHLADKILQSKSAIEGERKEVTVLFADVKGSMDLAERLGPERWHDVLDRFFQILTAGVHRFEGTVNQYTGDGIMALFGAPISHEDHAHRAGYTALHLRDELLEFTRDIKRRHSVDFAVRIGIHSGDVIVGKIGDDLRMDYTAQGYTVGLAQRMESLASGGSIYLTSATAQLIRTFFELEDLGDFEIKGAEDPVHVFELRGVGTSRTRFDVSRARGLTRFVGRVNETSLLETSLDQGLAESSRTVGVVAQAGTGKSRLCYEFLESCRARGLTVFEARGLSHGMNIPLLPILELMRSFFGIEDRDSDRVAREKIAGRMLLLDASLQDEMPIIFDLLGVSDATRPMSDVDPDALQRRLYSALRKIVRADSDLDPGVLLIEDLHWLDPASDAMLGQIVDALAESKGLLVVNFRPEYRARWMTQSHYQQLSLLPLSEDALRELLVDLLGNDPSVAQLPAAIHARTGGNPFYIEEFVLSLVDNGHLEGVRGDYRLVTEFDRLPMPASVKTLLAARIDRLIERDKHVLQAASVIGKTFPESILSQVVDMPEADLADALRCLQDAEFLYEAALYPEREYSFKHPLTQEVAEESQLAARRATAHASVGRAYAALFPDHLDERAALLAHHWEAAGESVIAAGWHARAAERIATTNFQGAVDHWHRVDALLPDSGGSAETDELKGRAFYELLLRGFRTGLSVEDATVIIDRARDFHQQRDNQAQLARCLNAYGTILQSAGGLRDYREINREALAIADRLGDRELRVSLSLDRVYACFAGGLLDEAVAATEQVIDDLDGDTEFTAEEMGYSPLVMCTAFSVMPLSLLGRLDEAQVRCDEAHRMATKHESAESVVWMNMTQGELFLARGDYDGAIRNASESVLNAERSGSLFDATATRAWFAAALAHAGQWEGALSAMQEAIERSDNRRIGEDAILIASWSVPASHLGLGDLENARATVNECIDRCREQNCLVTLCRAHLVSAAIHRADPQSTESDVEADFAEAEKLIERMGARRLAGTLLEARGRLDDALLLYEEIGATGHVARIRRELRPEP